MSQPEKPAVYDKSAKEKLHPSLSAFQHGVWRIVTERNPPQEAFPFRNPIAVPWKELADLKYVFWLLRDVFNLSPALFILSVACNVFSGIDNGFRIFQNNRLLLKVSITLPVLLYFVDLNCQSDR